MTWWLWTLIWVMLVLGALVVLFLVGRSLWRKGLALARELGEATERLSAISDELETLSGGSPQAAEPAVFADPAQLRQQRILARKDTRHGARQGERQGSARPVPLRKSPGT